MIIVIKTIGICNSLVHQQLQIYLKKNQIFCLFLPQQITKHEILCYKDECCLWYWVNIILTINTTINTIIDSYTEKNNSCTKQTLAFQNFSLKTRN